MVERNFYRVGNGLFALEQTKGIVSVYDCGGQSQKVIDDSILEVRKLVRAQVDNLFISHYHKDHVNGLVALLSSFNVKRIFLPMVPNLTLVYNFSSARSNYHYADFILNPEGFIRGLSPDSFVFSVAESQQVGQDGESSRLNLDDVTGSSVLNGGFAVVYLENWEYRLFNRRCLTPTELDGFMSRLGLSRDATTDEIISALQKSGKNSLLESLRAVFSKEELTKINDYSMVVWSGRSENGSNGCIYTGDYNAKAHMGDLQALFGSRLTDAEIIQIPHHGSVNNFNSALCSNSATHVISASGGPYRGRQFVDPSSVIDWMQKNGFREADTRLNSVKI